MRAVVNTDTSPSGRITVTVTLACVTSVTVLTVSSPTFWTVHETA